MSAPQSWSGGGRRKADGVRWSQKVTEMGQGTDKGGKRWERKEGRSYHDILLHLWVSVVPVLEGAGCLWMWGGYAGEDSIGLIDGHLCCQGGQGCQSPSGNLDGGQAKRALGQY